MSGSGSHRKKKATANPEEKPRSQKELNWAIKKPDAEPLLRQDIQWDLMNEIFADRTFLFTAPVDQAALPSAPIYLNFDQLYLEAILSSMKTTQNLRSKLIEQPSFAIAFCKICLLINVGRVNTTLAFYPQMKTALRTYHPVPSLQADDPSRKDMQDAPRIKGILKACFLDWEVTDQPSNLRDIAKKLASPELTRGPPTTVVTLIFHIMAEAGWVTEKYFPPGFDLLDLFYPSDMPSRPRAQAFLSLVHHMLENKSFLQDFDTPTPPPITLKKPIALVREADPTAPPENVDTAEELQYAKEMKEIRVGVVKTVPAYQKRDEQILAREAQKVQKEQEKASEAAAEPAKKKRKVGGEGGRSYARVAHETEMKDFLPDVLPYGWEEEDWSNPLPTRSSLPVTWQKVKRDMEENRDPDYDSDEEDAMSYDLLLRRRFLTVVNPTTGQRGPVTDVAEYEELVRRKEQGIPDDESEPQYPGDEMEVGSEMGVGDDD